MQAPAHRFADLAPAQPPPPTSHSGLVLCLLFRIPLCPPKRQKQKQKNKKKKTKQKRRRKVPRKKWMSCNFPRDGAGGVCVFPRAPEAHSAEGTRRSRRAAPRAGCPAARGGRPRSLRPRRAGPILSRRACGLDVWDLDLPGIFRPRTNPDALSKLGPAESALARVGIRVGAGVGLGVTVPQPRIRHLVEPHSAPAPARLVEPRWPCAPEPYIEAMERAGSADLAGGGGGPSQNTPASSLAASPGPLLCSRARRRPPVWANSPLLTARRARVEPVEQGARPQGPAPTLHTRSPARAPVYSVPVYVGLTV